VTRRRLVLAGLFAANIAVLVGMVWGLVLAVGPIEQLPAAYVLVWVSCGLAALTIPALIHRLTGTSHR
jgi:hypothetical protein